MHLTFYCKPQQAKCFMLSLVMVGLNCVWTYAVKIDQQYVSIIVLFPPKEDEVIKDKLFSTCDLISVKIAFLNTYLALWLCEIVISNRGCAESANFDILKFCLKQQTSL